MFKVIALLGKKSDLSRDEFIEYYETKHGDPSIGETIRQDEENFLDRSKTRFIVVDEYGASSKR